DVAIADAARVRLGAYLAPGTKVTHEGFVDANAGTSGAAMIQGRVSRGVIVAEGSHIGGSASLLPSEGDHPITIGSGCLVGANAAWGSRSATAASSKPASSSPPAPKSPCAPLTTRTDGCSPRTTSPASRECSSGEIPPPASLRPSTGEASNEPGS